MSNTLIRSIVSPKHTVVFRATLDEPVTGMEGTFRIAEYAGRFTGTKRRR